MRRRLIASPCLSARTSLFASLSSRSAGVTRYPAPHLLRNAGVSGLSSVRLAAHCDCLTQMCSVPELTKDVKCGIQSVDLGSGHHAKSEEFR